MLGELLSTVQHYGLMVVAAVLCLPALRPIARFIFDDLETFKAEAGLRTETDRTLWALGFLRSNPYFYFKIACFIGAYLAVLVAAYQLLVRLFG